VRKNQKRRESLAGLSASNDRLPQNGGKGGPFTAISAKSRKPPVQYKGDAPTGGSYVQDLTFTWEERRRKGGISRTAAHEKEGKEGKEKEESTPHLFDDGKGEGLVLLPTNLGTWERGPKCV